MAQHFWFSQRAVLLQETCFAHRTQLVDIGRQNLALYLRYQTTHDRAFHKCSDQLRKLRAEKRKAEIRFERQGAPKPRRSSGNPLKNARGTATNGAYSSPNLFMNTRI